MQFDILGKDEEKNPNEMNNVSSDEICLFLSDIFKTVVKTKRLKSQHDIHRVNILLHHDANGVKNRRERENGGIDLSACE